MSERIQEIITALRFCKRDKCGNGCPRYDKNSTCGDRCARELAGEAADIIESLQRETEPVPLTWEQIEGMSGKPVWMEDLSGKSKSRWEIIGFIQGNAKRENDGRAFMVSHDEYYTRFRYQRKMGIEFRFYATDPKGEATS